MEKPISGSKAERETGPASSPLLGDGVLAQLQSLQLDSGRPLIVTDADEVLVQFIYGLERFLDRNGCWLDLKSFAITGNVRRKGDDTALSREQVTELLGAFFAADTGILDPVEGAATALRALSSRAQIIVLSNLPQQQYAARRDWLRRHGMNYPLIANSGSKGGPMQYLDSQMQAPLFFLDDLPPHIDAVAALAPGAHLLHFIADRRLAALVGPAKNCHLHTSDWPEARIFIEQKLAESGF